MSESWKTLADPVITLEDAFPRVIVIGGNLIYCHNFAGD